MEFLNKFKCKDDCPNNVTEELIVGTIRPKINSLYENKTKSARIIVHEQEDLNFGYDIFGGVFTLCTQEVLMVDFDHKDGFTDEKSISYIKNFTDFLHQQGYDMLFEMYKTDRGMHAFLVNRLFHFTSEEALKIMIDLCSDADYIGYVEVRGFCIRLTPKIKKSDKFEVRNTINKEFTAIPYEENFRIGYGEPILYIENILNFHIDMITCLKRIYQDNIEDFITKSYIVESDSYDIFPSERIFNVIKNLVENKLNQYDLLRQQSKYFTAIRRKINNVIKIYEQSNIGLYYNIETKKFYMCSNNIIKMRFKLTDDSQKMEILNDLNANHGLNSFWIYDNEKELVLYLVNAYEPSENFDKEITKVYFQTDYPDIEIYAFNFCEDLNTDDNIIFKKREGEIIKIGTSDINNGIICTLLVQSDIMEFITNLYEENKMNIRTRYINQIYGEANIPSDEMFEKIKDKFIRLLDSYKIEDEEITFKNERNKLELVNSYRYSDLFDQSFVNKDGQSAVDDYSRRSVTQVSKNPNYKDIRFLDNFQFKGLNYWISKVLGPFLRKNSKNQITLLNGPLYPFILGFDLTRKMMYIRFYDLLMLDWDTHDGLPKTSPIMLIDRFLNYQSSLPIDKRVSIGELCFKFYETDNGVHAFVVSHRMIFYLDSSSICMVHTCADFYYATMARYYGYSIRLNPKIQNPDMSLKTIEQVKSQFTQKLGVNCDYEEKLNHQYIKNDEGKITYFGNLKMIDPYLDSLTNFIYNIQNAINDINRREDLIDKINNVNIHFLEDFRRFTADLYNNTVRGKNNEFISQDHILWATGSNAYYYKTKNMPYFYEN